MRLLSKTVLLILTVSIIIFMIGNIVFFYISKQMISNHVNSELVLQMHSVIKEQKMHPHSICINEQTQIKKIADAVVLKPQFKDTLIYSTVQRKYVINRALVFSLPLNDGNYKIELHKSLLSSDKLVERITISSILMVIIFVIAIYVLNKFIFEKVWADFFLTLKMVEKYDISKQNKMELNDSEIEEFDTLNKVFQKLINRIETDYINLKELTEDTSHEIQTPLAIIKGKAEMLLQSPNLQEEELEAVSQIINTSERLSKLNKSLLLIAKIENEQFVDAQNIDIKEVLDKYIQNFEMFFEAGEFSVSIDTKNCLVLINPILLDVLLSNLLKNAVTHNIKGGNISIALNTNVLTVCNSGEPLNIKQEDIFKRFSKGSVKKSSSGLGLEIVKRISNYYSLGLMYDYQNDLHSFSIDFKNIVE